MIGIIIIGIIIIIIIIINIIVISLSLLSNKVKANCFLGKECTNWNYSQAQTVSIQKPEILLIPKVIVSIPSLTSTCDSLVVDLSYSLGSCGRKWNNFSFTLIATDSNPTDLYSIENYLYDRYIYTYYHYYHYYHYCYYSFNDEQSAITLTKGIFEIGSYRLSVKLTNFLGVSSEGVAEFRVVSLAVPFVTIFGASSRTIQRYQYYHYEFIIIINIIIIVNINVIIIIIIIII